MYHTRFHNLVESKITCLIRDLRTYEPVDIQWLAKLTCLVENQQQTSFSRLDNVDASHGQTKDMVIGYIMQKLCQVVLKTLATKSGLSCGY